MNLEPYFPNQNIRVKKENCSDIPGIFL